ncbi:uncharacterized protein CDAR_610561, partial [Caerostris darwini]
MEYKLSSLKIAKAISSSKCPTNDLFSCKKSNSYYKCIPKSWRCDGFADCTYGEDEANCKDDKGSLQSSYLKKKKSCAVNWTYKLRNDENPTRKWSSEVARIDVAFYLSNNTIFAKDKTFREEIAYELSLDLLSRLAVKKIKDVELRRRVNVQNYTNPSVLLALCNAGDRITERDVQKLLDLFGKAHTEFWTDTQALAILALTCASKQPYAVYDLGNINTLTMELKRRQFQNGTVENLKTTALVMQ